MNGEQWMDLAAAYALDALDGEEKRAFEARLQDDGELRSLVDEYRAAAGTIAETLTPTAPPAAVRERVLVRIRGSDRFGTGGASETEPGTPSGERDDPPSQSAGGSALPASRRFNLGGLALAASVAGLVWLGLENRTLRSESGDLARQLDEIRLSLSTAEAELARFDSLALLLSGPDVRMATLTGDDLPPSLRLVFDPSRQVLLIAAQNLPAPAPGRTYQLWGLRGDDAPVSLGVFDTGATGTALLTRPLTGGADFELSAITDEPVGGSPGPTTTPFLVGAWSTAQN